MATPEQPPHIFWEEKISIEPDLGDQRQSTYKALPSPPKTPKRVLMKYRISGVVPLILSIAAFVLSLVVVLAGQGVGTFEGQYLVALNTSRLGQDLITFERASATSAAPSASASASTAPDPLDALNPFSPDSPLNPANPDSALNGLGDSLGNLAGNLTDAVNSGLGDVINSVVAGAVNQTGVQGFYALYLQKICSGSIVAEGNADRFKIDDCRSYEEAGNSMSALSRRIRTSIVIGQTQVSIPLLARLFSSADSTLDSLNMLRKAMLGVLIITLIGSILSAISILPAMYFPQSRLLVYFNIFWPGLATGSGIIAAVLISALNVIVGTLDGLGDTVGVQVRKGGTVLLFAWLSFVVTSLVTGYWASVWFVETRKSSFVKRRRDEDEVGHWRGIGREVWRDVKGRRKQPKMRAGI